MAKSDGGTGSDFKSSLKSASERFLSQTVVHVLEKSFRTPDDFLRHFKPADLMQGLEGAPDLRAKILIEGAGVHEKIARRKSTTSAAEDLRLALDEGVTNAAQLLTLLPPDDRVRYFDHKKLWAFTTEDEFWSPLNAEANVDGALSRVVFLLENALRENLLSLQVLTDGITFDSISTRLPLKELQKLVRHALKLGREKKPLSEQELLESVPLKTLIGFIPLEHVFNNVLVEKVAKPAGFIPTEGWDAGRAEPAKAEPPKAEPPAKPKAEKPEKLEPLKAEPAKTEEQPKSVPPPKPAAPASGKQQPLESLTDIEDDVDALIQSTRPPAEEEARRKVIDRLTTLNRLPPRHDTLTTPVLLSIESMYSELLSASTDDAREASIRDSFPNEQQMTTALLALIELLDPTIDINDPVIKDADADSLIKVVLFEERHRYEQQNPSARPSPGPAPLPPPNSARKGSLAPPPLPRQSSLPPPLPEGKRAR
ncbi:MAG: hypothetical protein EOO73_10070 [Myxococcales bacterium]|nr:MAG: hypothetical protein EOO73_10070 [Myxococcales bacterium]